MTTITVQGLGLVGAFGCGTNALLEALALGWSPRTPLAVPTDTGTVTLETFRADTSPLQCLLSPRVLRRMDHFTRMGLLGAQLALKDAGLEPSGQKDMGLIVASGFGATTTTYALLDSIINDGDVCTSPTHFANSLHSTCAANIAIGMGITGPNLTVSQFDLSVASALLTARQWLLDGRVERVLFGAIDELSDLIGYTWYRQRGMTRPEPMSPLDISRQTAIPGEGSAFMVLSRRKETQPAYCTLGAVTVGRCLTPESLRNALGGEPLVIAADGRREVGARYATLVEGTQLACFTSLYGCMPASPAFDLAIGALMLKNGCTYATTGECDFSATVVPPGPADAARITCLTVDGEEGFGMVELGLPPANWKRCSSSLTPLGS